MESWQMRSSFMVLTVLACISFGAEPATTRPAIDWGDAIGGLRIGIDTTPRFVGAGSAIDVVVSVNNTTNADRTVGYDGYDPCAPIDLCGVQEQSPNGKVKKTLYATDDPNNRVGSGRIFGVAPHETKLFTLRVNRMLDMSVADRYSIQFLLRVGEDGTGKPTIAKSKQLQILVADSDEDAATEAKIEVLRGK